MFKPKRREHSTLAAVIVLHGGPTPEQLYDVLLALNTASIDSESYSFGPAHAQAELRLDEAREVMKRLIDKL